MTRLAMQVIPLISRLLLGGMVLAGTAILVGLPGGSSLPSPAEEVRLAAMPVARAAGRLQHHDERTGRPPPQAARPE
ncbi:MAG TPA: hypothetical protein VHL31_24305 [Geminicoccus sp.]|jgi:hypothetical protein|uniref:hypothetical protein n=1 Tax=Geminicoccus sp. TaxID=2024832 RepID=UPI002E333E38|nr:hypothetical protein [Geminicoccus sp.]HEX2529403.1 hypothetical protein [Geminicoccus sp.]